MAKTRRIIKESLSLVDAVTEIVDARIPLSSSNPELNGIISGKPKITLLNKCDMADERASVKWIEYYKKNGVAAMAVDCRSGKGLNNYHKTVRELLKDKIQRNIDKGMAGKPIRIMVVGIPNTGKSSFINRMAGKSRAKVADKPGVTRQNQWFAIGNGIELLDTPGVLWPKFEDSSVGDKLAFTGSVKDEVIDVETLALRLVEAMLADYKDRLIQRYKLENIDGLCAYETLEAIARKRGMLIRGGETDTQRVSVMLLDEYRAGLLGRLTLDSVPE